MRLVMLAICLSAMLGFQPADAQEADSATVARQDWDAWFGEYDLVSDQATTADQLFTMFPARFAVGPAKDSVESRLRYDTGARNIRVYAGEDGSYFVDYLPLFVPSDKARFVAGVAFECAAQSVSNGYEVTCTTKDQRVELRSFYERGVGVAWFDFFCGQRGKVCRYRYSRGKRLLNPALLSRLQQRGDLALQAR